MKKKQQPIKRTVGLGYVLKADYVIEFLLFLVLFLAPQVFLINHYDFANLPQQAFIHVVSTIFLGLLIILGNNNGQFRLVWTNYYIPVLGFLVWAALSILWGHNKYEGIFTVTMWIGPATLFLGIVNCDLTLDRINRLLHFVFISAILSGIIGCLQYLIKFPLIPQVIEPAATFANKNMVSHIMLLSIPLGVGLFLLTRSNWKAYLYALGTSVLLLLLYYTKTKAGWLGLLVEAVLFATVLWLIRPPFIWDRHKQIASLVGILFLGIFMNLTPYGWSLAFKEITQRAELVKGAVEGKDEAEEAAYASVGLRLAIWRNTLEMIKDRPIFGFGLGNHKVYYPIYHRKAVVEKVFSEEAQLHNVHNDYLQIFSETGVIGFSFLSILFLLWVLSVKRLAIDRKISQVSIWAICIFISIIGLMVNAAFCFPSFRAVPPMIVMAFTGILFGLEQSSAGYIQKGILIKKPINLFIGAAIFSVIIFLGLHYAKLLKSDYYYLLLSRYETKKQWQSMVNIAKNELELEPKRAKIRSYLGRAYIEIGKCKEGAEELEKVISDYPYHMNALLNLGVAYGCTGEYEKSLEKYKKVLEIKPDYAKVYNNIGHIYLKMGDYAKGIEALKEAEKISPNDATIALNIGILYMNKNDLESAITYLKKATVLDPKRAQAFRNLGLAYLNAGKKELGQEALNRALMLDPKGQGAEELRKVLRGLRETQGEQ